MTKCIIKNCPNVAKHNISIRCRRPNTSAIWAPNTIAFLCDTHAEQGCTIEINIVPNTSNSITTIVSGGGHVETRVSKINHKANE